MDKLLLGLFIAFTIATIVLVFLLYNLIQPYIFSILS